MKNEQAAKGLRMEFVNEAQTFPSGRWDSMTSNLANVLKEIISNRKVGFVDEKLRNDVAEYFDIFEGYFDYERSSNLKQSVKYHAAALEILETCLPGQKTERYDMELLSFCSFIKRLNEPRKLNLREVETAKHLLLYLQLVVKARDGITLSMHVS